MSLKDGKKGTGTNERIAVGSGGRRRGEGRRSWRMVEVCAGWAHRVGKRGWRGGARPVGRYFCACFVFNFSPPFARRGADAVPRRTAPHHTASRHAAPRRALRRDAGQRSAGWLVCGCLSSYAYLSASHIDSGRHYAS